MLTELKKLAGDFLTQPLTRGREIRDLLEGSPVEFCSAAVELLGGEDSERVQRYLVALLGTNNLLIPCLTAPSMPLKKAESIATIARRVDPQLPAKLVGFALERTDTEPSECLERILGLLKSMPDAAAFRPLLTPLLRHPDARIRSKVALLAGEGNRNGALLEKRSLENDTRIRANAIKKGTADDLQPVLTTVASEANQRVAGNVLVALYRQGEAAAVAGLQELASRQDPAFRSTALWAMSETGDTRFLPLVARFLTDPNQTIKAAAFNAIRKLRLSESASTQVLDVRIVGKPWFEGSTLSLAFGVSNGSKPITGIAATKIRILVNGELAYRYSIVEQECPRRISAAFLVPRIADQASERSDGYRNALEGCFEQRRMDDGWWLSQYSGSAAREPLFQPERLLGLRIDSAQMSQIQQVESLTDLRKAIETARCLELTAAFLGLCRKLTLSRGSAHLFLFRPDAAPPLDLAGLIEVAREAQVSVHAICSSTDENVRQMCRATGGFYAVTENVPKTLSGFYRGISHRYLASLAPDTTVRQVQVAVRTPDSSGESSVWEINH
jgi:hypothetical protein